MPELHELDRVDLNIVCLYSRNQLCKSSKPFVIGPGGPARTSFSTKDVPLLVGFETSSVMAS
jgi:hypothetical protein